MRTRSILVSLVSSVLCAAACAGAEPDEPVATAANTADESATSSSGITKQADDTYSFRTEPAHVEPGQERYLCFAQTLDEDLVIDKYEHAAQSHVHHIVFVRTLAPEPDGLSECDTLFRNTWDPLFLTGAGRSTLEFPEGAGHKLTKGTQLLVQLHLLNTTTQPIEEPVEIEMRRSSAEDPTPVGTYSFGTRKLNLPANQESSVKAGCEMTEDLHVIAAFPHMHRMGRSLRFEVGSSEDSLETKFLRDPYDFDDQHVEPLELSLSPGDQTRVTCAYENTTPNTVTFGESTTDEMCFFIAFALNRSKIAGCMH